MVQRKLFHAVIEGFCKDGPWAWSNYIVADDVVRACALADIEAAEHEYNSTNVRVSEVCYAGVVFVDGEGE